MLLADSYFNYFRSFKDFYVYITFEYDFFEIIDVVYLSFDEIVLSAN